MRGHNSFGNWSAEQLRQFIERVERLEEEKRNIAEDIKEVFAEAKGSGFDVSIMKAIIKLRRKDQSDLEEEEYMLDTYKRALGMIPEQADMFEEPENAEPTSGADAKNIMMKNRRALDSVKKMKVYGDACRKAAQDHGMDKKYADKLIEEKAEEIYRKIGLPKDEVIAAMQ